MGLYNKTKQRNIQKNHKNSLNSSNARLYFSEVMIVKIRSNKFQSVCKRPYIKKRRIWEKRLKRYPIESFTCLKSFTEMSCALAATFGLFYHYLVHNGLERRLSRTNMS